MNTLIIYSTTDGQTLKISRRLEEKLKNHNHHITVYSIEESSKADLESFDQIIIGASIRYGHHSKQTFEFIEKNQKILETKPNAFFSVNLVARKPEKRSAETNPYTRKFLNKISWKPKRVAVFAGKLDYPRYPYWDRQIIRLIMWMTKGPTDPSTIIEYTDWKQVDNFALELSGF